MLDGKTQSVLGEMWQEACKRGGNLSFKIVSGSMSPMIEVGNVVRVSRTEPSKVRIGDIVAFKQDGQSVVVHRIIGKSLSDARLTFREMGDAGGPSGRIAAQDIIGRAIVIEKDGREICLDSPRHILGSRVFGWRLLLVETLGRMQNGHFSTVVKLTLRPMWRLCRRLLLWRL